jgi:hypothetical protein
MVGPPFRDAGISISERDFLHAGEIFYRAGGFDGKFHQAGGYQIRPYWGFEKFVGADSISARSALRRE